MTILSSFNIALNLWGAVVCLFCFVCVLLNVPVRQKPAARHLMAVTLIVVVVALLSYSACVYLDGMPGRFMRILNDFLEFTYFTLCYCLVYLFVCYYEALSGLRHAPHSIRHAVHIAMVIAELLLILSQFYGFFYYIDESNIYHRGAWFPFSQLYPVAVFVICGIGGIVNRKKMEKGTLAAGLIDYLLIIALVPLQTVCTGISFVNLSIVLIAFHYFIVQIQKSVRLNARQQEELARREKELSEMQTKIMISQIQPHFLYNALTTIYYLCGSDPKAAQNTVRDFSDYLRMNLDSLSLHEPVPFEKELEHVQHYLAIEQQRFKDRLTVEYDIRCCEFCIPALTVQPLAENAVRYGACALPEGGTVKITAEELPDCYRVVVADNGPGYDPDAKKEDGRSHVGIENVRSRLASMCGGTLSVAAVPEGGTKAVILIPKPDDLIEAE